MVEEGPLPDFMERKELLDVINEKLEKAGYIRVAFESYALPTDPMMRGKKTRKGSLWCSRNTTWRKSKFCRCWQFNKRKSWR